MTEKLFYEDSHMITFSAVVEACEKVGEYYEAVLDRTAFFPEGGGQFADTGVIDGVKVLDAQEKEGIIYHKMEAPIEVGKQVDGVIDWEERFSKMQQHSGEHIVSGLVHAAYGYDNVGFHMGSDMVTIDFDGMIGPEALQEIETEANRAVWENIPIRCWYPSPEELPNVFYRTKKALPWPVRIVEVPGFDRCACCGVHVAHTGEVGLIKILSLAKFHDGVRLGMLCGKRAYDYLGKIFEENRKVSQVFSAKMPETGNAAVRMNEALSAEKFRAAALEKRLFAFLAEQYRGKGDVAHLEDGLNPAGVRDLADAIAAVCGGRAAVLSGVDGNFAVCLIHQGGDVKEFANTMKTALNGRGGGKPGTFQGTLNATKAEIKEFFKF